MPVVSAICGAAFTVAVCVALGSLLLRWLRLEFYRNEAILFFFVAGSACLSLAVMLLCIIHQATLTVFLTGGAIAIGCALWKARGAPRRDPLPPLPRAWQIVFTIVFAAFFICYFLNALAPEISPDGSSYHLGNVARDLRHHGFDWDFHSIYSSLPQGMEMLFLVAFSIGRHSSAALVQFTFQAVLPLFLLSYGRRFGCPRAGAFAGLLTYTCPVAGIDGISAYNDLAIATLIFAGFYLTQVKYENHNVNRLFLIGLLAGAAFAVKYTAGMALPLSAVLTRGRRMAILAAGTAVSAGPWLLRNWLWLHNPAAPFLNFWFPNPYWTSAAEHQYLAGLGQYPPFHSYLNLIWQLTVLGGLVPGMTGPVLLLLPLALLALRQPHGRRILLAGIVYSIPAFFNTEIRFLIPAIPFLFLAIGLGIENSPGALPALALFQAILCWPSIMTTYCDPNAWRVRGLPVRAAFRIEPESEYIGSHVGDYALRSVIDRDVPAARRIFSFAGRAAAYLDRDIVVGYESTQGMQLEAALNQADLSALRSAGISFLLVNDSDAFAQYTSSLHLTALAKANETTLYRLD